MHTIYRDIGYVEVHIHAAYIHLKQPPEKALRMLLTQNKFGLRISVLICIRFVRCIFFALCFKRFRNIFTSFIS